MSQPEKPTERIYLSKPSWLPALTAGGLAAIIVGLFAWWPYAVAGALVAIVSFIAWLRDNRAEIAEMPVSQATDTAPIPLSGRE
jgi:hypothetical protein